MMKHKFVFISCVLILTTLFTACDNDTMLKAEYADLVGNYSGDLYKSEFTLSPSSQVKLSVVEFAQSEVTFYFEFLGTTDVLQFDRVNLESGTDYILFNKVDDSGIRIEGKFEKDGSSCTVSILDRYGDLKGEIFKD